MKNKKIYITNNKKAKFIYFIEKEIEVGLSLLGWEVKSLRFKKINIEKSYIKIKNFCAYLFNYNITPIDKNFIIKKNSIKLLLKKKELLFISNKIKKDGYTLIPLSIYWKNNWSKLNIGISKGKKKYDKRKIIKDREWKINKNRILKKYL